MGVLSDDETGVEKLLNKIHAEDAEREAKVLELLEDDPDLQKALDAIRESDRKLTELLEKHKDD